MSDAKRQAMCLAVMVVVTVSVGWGLGRLDGGGFVGGGAEVAGRPSLERVDRLDGVEISGVAGRPSLDRVDRLETRGQESDLDRLWDALIIVESGGRERPPIGAAGEVGIAQILPIMVDECNRIAGPGTFDLGDRWNAERSRAMFDTFMGHWRRGRSIEWCARAWNGGSGWHKRGPKVAKMTAAYWGRIQEHLKG